MRRNRKFIILSLFTLGVVIGCLALFSYYNTRNIERQNREYLTDNTRLVAANIDRLITDGYRNIRILAELLGNSLKSPDVDVASLQQLLENSVFDFIEFADRHGMDHNITGGVTDARDRLYYLRAMQGESGMELIYHSRATHETLLMYYAPVRYRGEIIGSLVGAYQARRRITDYLRVSYYGEPATSYLCDTQGRVVAATHAIDPAAAMQARQIAADDAALADRIEASILSGEELVFTLQKGNCGGCLVHLPESDWHLVQLFPVKAQRAMIQYGRMLGIHLTLALIAIFLIAIHVVARYRSRKTRELEENYQIIKGIGSGFIGLRVVDLVHDKSTVFIPLKGIYGMEEEEGCRNTQGCSIQTTLQQFVATACHPDHQERMRELADLPVLSHLLEGKFRHSERVRAKDLTGEYHWYDLVFIKFDADRQAPATRMAVGLINVDDEVRRDEEHRHALAEVQRIQTEHRMKTEFVQNVSHEIRTPLNAIMGFASLLCDDQHPLSAADRQTFRTCIAQNTDLLLTMVDELLNLSDIERGVLEVTMAQTLCNQVGHKTIACSLSRVRQEVRLYYTTEVDDCYCICSDSRRIQQILVHLVWNASKFTTRGEIHLHCSDTERPGHLTYSVTDTGCGLSPQQAAEVQARLQPDGIHAHSHVRGLDICRDLTQRIGGALCLDTTYTAGARFLLVLPVGQE